jgi:tol-pal system protein YbgF
MRFPRYATHPAMVCAILFAPLAASAAPSKEMQDLQRDVAMLADQVTAMQKANTAALGSMQTSIDQISGSVTKTSGAVSGLNSSLTQTLQNEIKTMRDQLSSVSGLSLKVSTISEDVSNLVGSVKDMQSSLNKQGQMISDLANQIKLMQAPAPAPPPADGSAPGPTAAAPQQPGPQTLFDNAKRDLDASRFDLAVSGFQNFLRLYPNDPNAVSAQYNLGTAYYQTPDLENAVKAYDAVIERYPKDDSNTPLAYYMKGMALQKLNRKTEAIASYKAVLKDYPDSDEASQATQRLHSLNVTVKSPTKGAAKKSGR